MSTDVLEFWGANIRTWREERGLTREDFAAELGVTLATVSRWEAGKMAPKDENKVEIATVLGVEVRTLFPLMRSVA